ncbi:hypothetical protein, unknown function [Leishmania tarentolae]|uniref:Ubiquitin-like domain-containing protein n=1 Tax=Leishmania tarentolae TaxID=5689 RepID=A0A640KUI6_LEITA|nr:hypothetical protein, unknown function [Leishmania tarentolae]
MCLLTPHPSTTFAALLPPPLPPPDGLHIPSSPPPPLSRKTRAGRKTMKLQPRERRPLSDYILDNAAALQLGKLYLGWGRGKKRPSKPKRKVADPESKLKATAVDSSTRKRNKTAPRTPTKHVPARPTTSAPRKVECPLQKQRNTTLPAAAVKSMPPKARSRGRPPTTPAKSPPKAAARKGVRTRKNPTAVATPISSKVVSAAAAAVSTSAKVTYKPPPRAPRKNAVVLPTKTVVQHRRRANTKVPPVIPTPVPTPALPLGGADHSADSGDVTVLVRTMNGTSFRLACASELTLCDLKRRILEVIMPWNASASPSPMVRLPMLVMNGRALAPESATLSALRFSAEATVYCFPEPN